MGGLLRLWIRPSLMVVNHLSKNQQSCHFYPPFELSNRHYCPLHHCNLNCFKRNCQKITDIWTKIFCFFEKRDPCNIIRTTLLLRFCPVKKKKKKKKKKYPGVKPLL